MSRIDEIRKFYKTPEKLELVSGYMFYIIAGLAVVLPLTKEGELRHWLAVIFIMLVVVYFGISCSKSLFLQPHSEKMRRKQLLSDSFAFALIPERTHEYYNNQFGPSVAKLGANVLENSLFSQRVLEKMLITERIKVGLYFFLWVGALASGKVHQDVLIIISQTVFSTEVLAHWVSMELLRHKYSEVHKELYRVFLTKQHETQEGTPLILDGVLNYECAKSAASIVLSEKIFDKKVNPLVTVEWEELKKRIGI